MGPPPSRIRNTTINKHAGGDGHLSTGEGGADVKLLGQLCDKTNFDGPTTVLGSETQQSTSMQVGTGVHLREEEGQMQN